MRYLSLCSGIGAPEAAWRTLGWTCAGHAEIDKAALAVYEHRFPGTPNLGDIAKVTEADIAALGPIDLIVAGTPYR